MFKNLLISYIEVGVNIKDIWNHHPVRVQTLHFPSPLFAAHKTSTQLRA